MPVLWITGADDERYGQIAARAVRAIGSNARHEAIDGAGHAAHLERADEATAVISEFVRRHGT
jgi:pimeloyl-ACP methyl ester carboxylesterase